MQPAWINSNSNQKYCHHFKKEKNYNFFLKKTSATKKSPIKFLLYGMLSQFFIEYS